MSEALTCPKCGGAMRSYERNNVTVDQCGDCRGIFLDRGELEHLIDAENSFYEREQPARPQEQRRDDREHGGHKKKSKKRSFLENLMEMGGE